MKGLYIIPDLKQIRETELFAKEQGLCYEYNDFIMPSVLDDEEEIQKRIAAYQNLQRDFSKDTMHGAFFDVTVFSYDEKIREVSMLRMRRSMDIAKQMGLRGVVFHGNYFPFLRGNRYDTNWLEQTEKAVRTLAKEYPEIEIYMENMFDDTPEMLCRLAESLRDVPTFGICLDYSHALILSRQGEPWFQRLGAYVRHIHVNDHCFEGDVHLVPGEGKTDWEEFFRLRQQYAPDASIHCEVTGLEKAKQGIVFLKNYL